jgi:amino acid adenylation domain-containing protein
MMDSSIYQGNNSGPPGDLPPSDDAGLQLPLPRRFEQIVDRYPHNTAVKYGNEAVDYAGLNRAANRLAHAILALRGGSEKPVALLFEPCINMIVGILGVWKAGRIYVPLEVFIPLERNREMMQDSGAGILVTNTRHLPMARALSGETGEIEVLCVDQLGDDLPVENPAVELFLPSRAAIFYTSGSTGKPKGLLYNHGPILSWVRKDIPKYGLRSDDRIVLVIPYGFGLSLLIVSQALASGATLYLHDTRKGKASELLCLVAEEQITILPTNPSFFRYLVSRISDEMRFPALRLITLSGETVTRRDVELFQCNFGSHCTLTNKLGAGEVGMIAELFIDHTTHIAGKIVPVGYPPADKEVRLLNEKGDEVGPGEVGEIAVRSRNLATGYWRDPELTRQKLLPDPEGGDRRICLTGDLGRWRDDGCLEHLGRKDFQVKIRGQRVEIAEVEMTLREHPAIEEAAVVAHDDARGEKQLVAYIVPAEEPGPSSSELREALEETLPAYMIPPFYVRLEALPLTPTGKVDRLALPELDTGRPELGNPYVAPGDALETRLVQIWETVLGIQPVGVEDDFFDLGGHSLLALRLVADVEKELGRALPLDALFRASTVRQLAAEVRAQEAAPRTASLVALRTGGDGPPLYCIHPRGGHVLRYYHLVHYLDETWPVYGLRAQGLDGRREPYTRVEEMAAHYLREIRAVQPQGPYYLLGFSLGGKIAFEMARQLEQQGQAVALLIMIDTYITGGPDPEAGEEERQAEPETRTARQTLARIRAWAGRMRRRYLARGVAEQNGEGGWPPAKRVQEANKVANRRYAPRLYGGRITFFEASRGGNGADPLAWSPWAAKGMEVITIPGDHRSILEEPEVRALAEKINRVLARTRVDL